MFIGWVRIVWILYRVCLRCAGFLQISILSLSEWYEGPSVRTLWLAMSLDVSRPKKHWQNVKRLNRNLLCWGFLLFLGLLVRDSTVHVRYLVCAAPYVCQKLIVVYAAWRTGRVELFIHRIVAYETSRSVILHALVQRRAKDVDFSQSRVRFIARYAGARDGLDRIWCIE